ncbi:MAG: BMC domain-containing protein [Shewanella sp.]
MYNEVKERVIQEYVPGKQITLLHLIANPNRDIYQKMGLNSDIDAIGIMTITPSEAAIIAGDIATKSGSIKLGFVDRFTGSVIITGDISSVEYALKQVSYTMGDIMKFNSCELTRT